MISARSLHISLRENRSINLPIEQPPLAPEHIEKNVLQRQTTYRDYFQGIKELDDSPQDLKPSHPGLIEREVPEGELGGPRAHRESATWSGTTNDGWILSECDYGDTVHHRTIRFSGDEVRVLETVPNKNSPDFSVRYNVYSPDESGYFISHNFSGPESRLAY